jgi:predicted alpha/beta superfamily hydrolase
MKKYTALLIAVISILFLFHEMSAQSELTESEVNETLIIDTIYSETIEEYREFWVKYPETYNPNSPLKYPVVYLIDGFSLKNSLETIYDNYWGHYLPNMILVGISNKANRTRDLTTSQIKSRRGRTMAESTGGAERFTQFIEKELIPYIDKNHPTTPYRTLIGHSYGGLFTLNVLMNHQHMFENYIAIDPSIEWDNQK